MNRTKKRQMPHTAIIAHSWGGHISSIDSPAVKPWLPFHQRDTCPSKASLPHNTKDLHSQFSSYWWVGLVIWWLRRGLQSPPPMQATNWGKFDTRKLLQDPPTRLLNESLRPGTPVLARCQHHRHVAPLEPYISPKNQASHHLQWA